MSASEGEPFSPSFMRDMRSLYGIMSPRRKMQLSLTMLMTFLGAIAELVTIGAVLPLLAVVANTGYAGKLAPVSGLLNGLGALLGTSMIGSAAIFLIAAALLSASTRLTLTWVMQKFIFGLHQDIALTAFGRTIRQPYELFVRQNSSTAISGIEKIYFVTVGIVSPVILATTSAAIAVFIIAFLFVIDPVAAFFASLSMGILYAAMTIFTRRALVSLSARMAEIRTERVKLLQESLGGIRDIMLDHSQSVFERKLKALESDMWRLQARSNFLSTGPRFVVEGCGIILVALLALWFSTRPGGILAAIPVLGALALGAQRLLPLLQAVYNGWASYSINAHTLQHVLALLDTPVSTVRSLVPGETVIPFGEEIELRDVCFGYGEGPLALEHLDMTIRKGERVGLIGKTGSGKSTLVDLLMGLLRPTNGSIMLSGTPVDDDNIGNWQAQIAHVPQAIFLSDDSIAANIAFGAEGEIDMDRVWEAARRSDISEFIEQLPNGLETRVGERGVRLSGGQRQRIGIARALYKNATVLILDEATSALDDRTEAAVMESVASLDRDLTVVMIAHRLSTVAGCDTVYRMDRGRFVQKGSYADVVLARQVSGEVG